MKTVNSTPEILNLELSKQYGQGKLYAAMSDKVFAFFIDQKDPVLGRIVPPMLVWMKPELDRYGQVKKRERYTVTVYYAPGYDPVKGGWRKM